MTLKSGLILGKTNLIFLNSWVRLYAGVGYHSMVLHKTGASGQIGKRAGWLATHMVGNVLLPYPGSQL